MKTFRHQPPPSAPMPKRTHSRRVLLGTSATTYLTLCVWLGPTAAFWLTVIGGWTLFWFWLCGRFPVLGWFTSAFLTGFIGGLFGARGGGYGYYSYGPRRRRRR
jgi:hypothetical protein